MAQGSSTPEHRPNRNPRTAASGGFLPPSGGGDGDTPARQQFMRMLGNAIENTSALDVPYAPGVASDEAKVLLEGMPYHRAVMHVYFGNGDAIQVPHYEGWERLKEDLATFAAKLSDKQLDDAPAYMAEIFFMKKDRFL
jgi:hypothetical protein